MLFSQRIGKKAVKVNIQIEEMDQELRNSLWSAFQIFYLDKVENRYISYSGFNGFFKILWLNYFKLPLDNLDNDYHNTYTRIREWFFAWEWYEVYDFIEFVSRTDAPVNSDNFQKYCNVILERELSAYRFISEHLTKITNESEIDSIEEALSSTQNGSLKGVNTHLHTSLSLISDKKNPDYRNSIKESISAVESISRIISNNPKAELGQALKKLEEVLPLHGALRNGFSSLYGYTSNEGGIRHALMDESKIEFEDAKYMLVSCSAFVNYLIIKAEKAKIKI